MASKLEILEGLVKPVAEGLGLEFWGVEYVSQGRHTLLRVYIDSPEGVTLDHCEAVSRQVSAVLDVEDPIAGEYTLEVSSPGMDRPLFTIAQFEVYSGHAVSLRLRVPFDGRRKYKGVIKAVEGDEVVLQVEDHEYLFPIDSIEKANIVPRF
ncbi:ribosome maturation factor RimP [Aestuariirhabdus litorea]|uniref:Ribosome maturation factor RimP n=1 Tax=Aestuariirhabdus litorea TaxID=2528527 RepID=A0A3P3VKZ0_9GAMM|nr:ribosome maturation factor RimP [Aestuariirhabdus litorea]RRJ83350.1 ribosome maturation factor RimP [Aestuariirhabdus litorea]RWW93509.1 ribosome maturation factor RimP [Endozoicomonadaceae bacterium GTF-13]